MDRSLVGKVAVVTGAGRGIGLAVTKALVAEGAHVVAGSRTMTDDLRELQGAGRITAVQVDLTQPEEPARLADSAGRRIDILVNNVGRSVPRPQGISSVPDLDWYEVLTLNLWAAVRMTRAVLPGMTDIGAGSIINVVSANSVLPDPSLVDYSAAKAALLSVSKSLSKEFAASGIRVDVVNPGPVDTDRWRADQVGQVARRMVTGRLTRPDEVAAAVVLLASSHASNVTGARWAIDGGLVPTVK